MDSLPAFGTAIQDVILPTANAYEPLLLKQASLIRSTKRETFAYGSHPRQQLDLYTPSQHAAVSGGANRLLVFLYGGGFVSGDKINPHKFDGLVYANLGHYFAENLGSRVAIVDYRLHSHGAKFPSGGEDLRLAIEWLIPHLSEQSTGPVELFLMGNSAGGVHTATFLLASQFAETRNRLLDGAQGDAKLEGAILLGCPLHFRQARDSRSEVLNTYFDGMIDELCPLGLLESSKDKSRLPPVLTIVGELDPEDEILIPNRDFATAWKASGPDKFELETLTMEGHNHISPVLALGTGVAREEKWGKDVVNFINAHSSSASKR